MIRLVGIVFCLSGLLLPEHLQAQKRLLERILPQRESSAAAENWTALEKEQITRNIRQDLQFLAAPKSAGRMTGTIGEQAAGMYIEKRFKDEHILPYDNNYRQRFKFVFGKTLTPETRLRIGDQYLFIPEDAFPAAFSAGTSDENFVLPDSREPYGAWIIPLYESAREAHDPNFDWENAAYEKALYAADRGATSVVLYDQYGSSHFPGYQSASKYPVSKIPVMLLPRKTYDKHIRDMKTIQPYLLSIKYKNDYRNGTNILGYIDHRSASTVVITAHYDGLGEIRTGVSGGQGFYPGADGNASGVAALIALGSTLKQAPFNKYNYILAATSASHQESMGAKTLLNELKASRKRIAFVIDLNAIGRFKNTLIANGAYTSPSWQPLLRSRDQVRIIKDAAPDRAGDFQWFIENEIPTLSFTTGQHEALYTSDDIPGRINYPGITVVVEYIYQLLAQLDKSVTPVFNPQSTDATQVETIPAGKARQTNTFGIDPDTTYTGIGLKVAAVFKGQAAARAGIQPKDIVLQLNAVKINTEEDFIQAAKNLPRGKAVRIKVKRGPTVQEFETVF